MKSERFSLPRALVPLALALAVALGVGGCETSKPEPPQGAPAATSQGTETEPLLSVPAEPLVGSQPGVTDEARQRDVADCYAYSRALVNRDRRIDNDINAGTGGIATGTNASGLTRELREFGRESEQNRFFNSCMRSKGYVEQ